jgi:hypothetical protein
MVKVKVKVEVKEEVRSTEKMMSSRLNLVRGRRPLWLILQL